MKILYLFTFIFVFGLTTFSQSYSTQLEYQTVVSERVISLRGELVSYVSGKSRTLIPITLPKGTTSWYYSFSTGSAGSGSKNLQLLLQLAALAANPTNLGSNVIANIKIPSGSHSVDIYLIENQASADVFTNKVDYNGGGFIYNREGTVTATKQGVVNINKINNSTTSCFKNTVGKLFETRSDHFKPLPFGVVRKPFSV